MYSNQVRGCSYLHTQHSVFKWEEREVKATTSCSSTQIENILRLPIMLLSVHLSFIPLWALSSVAFQLLTEWRDSSERWGQQCGGCSGLWMEFILPERTSNRPASISQVEHRWLSHARRPSAQRFQMHRACPLTRQTDWHTDRERANWTAVTHTQTHRHTHLHPNPQVLWDPDNSLVVPRMAQCQISSKSLACFSQTLLLDMNTEIWRTSIKSFFSFYYLLSTISMQCNYSMVNIKERLTYGLGLDTCLVITSHKCVSLHVRWEHCSVHIRWNIKYRLIIVQFYLKIKLIYSYVHKWLLVAVIISPLQTSCKKTPEMI